MLNIIKRLLSETRRALGFVRMGFADVRSHFRTRSDYIADTIDGDVDLVENPRVAIFAHFDANGRVHPFVLHHLAELKAVGFAVVFVTNSPQLHSDSIEQLKPLVARILKRENVGYDFGAYKDGVLSLPDLQSLDELLLVNDSVYGPFRSLQDVFAEHDMADLDVVAMTDSWEVRFHLQSYFLLFRRNVLQAPEFLAFWKNLRYIDNKNLVVRRYEVGLSQLMIKLQFRSKALFPYAAASRRSYDKVMAMDPSSDEFRGLPKNSQDYYLFLRHSTSVGMAVNGSHFMWEILMADMNCPFVKRELLSKNPMKVPNLLKLEDLIAEQGDYQVEMIYDHLRGVNRDRALLIRYNQSDKYPLNTTASN